MLALCLTIYNWSLCLRLYLHYGGRGSRVYERFLGKSGKGHRTLSSCSCIFHDLTPKCSVFIRLRINYPFPCQFCFVCVLSHTTVSSWWVVGLEFIPKDIFFTVCSRKIVGASVRLRHHCNNIVMYKYMLSTLLFLCCSLCAFFFTFFQISFSVRIVTVNKVLILSLIATSELIIAIDFAILWPYWHKFYNRIHPACIYV